VEPLRASFYVQYLNDGAPALMAEQKFRRGMKESKVKDRRSLRGLEIHYV